MVLAVIVLLLVGPIVQILMAHQSSRLALSAALWDEHTIVIDEYEAIIGVDFAEREGHLLSDKAPGQPFLGALPYGLYRMAGGHSAADVVVFGNLALWWVSLVCSAIPAAVLAVLMRRGALAHAPPLAANVGALAVAVGTLLLPFGAVLFGHVLAATLAYGAWLAVRPVDASWQRLALGGLLAGAAVFTEFPTAIVVLVLGVLLLLRHKWRVVAYAAGGLVPAVALGLYNTAAFGGPLRFSYRFSGEFGAVHAEGLFGAQVPSLEGLGAVLIGERGLLSLTPIVAVGLVGLIALWRVRGSVDAGRRFPPRTEAVVALVVFTLFVLLQSGWVNPTGGASPGPRYVVPALPFLATGVAVAFSRAPRFTGVVAVLSAVPMLLATFTNPLAQPTEQWALGHWVWRALNDRLADSLLTALWGKWALALQLALALVLIVLLLRGSRVGVAQARQSAIAPASRSAAPAARPRNSDGSTSSSSSTSGPSEPSTRSTRP